MFRNLCVSLAFANAPRCRQLAVVPIVGLGLALILGFAQAAYCTTTELAEAIETFSADLRYSQGEATISPPIRLLDEEVYGEGAISAAVSVTNSDYVYLIEEDDLGKESKASKYCTACNNSQAYPLALPLRDAYFSFSNTFRVLSSSNRSATAFSLRSNAILNYGSFTASPVSVAVNSPLTLSTGPASGWYQEQRRILCSTRTRPTSSLSFLPRWRSPLAA